MWSPKRKLMFSKKRVNQNKERLRKITKTHPLRFVKPKLIHKHGKKNHKESPTLSLHLEPFHFFGEPRDIVTPHPTTRGHPMDDGSSTWLWQPTFRTKSKSKSQRWGSRSVRFFFPTQDLVPLQLGWIGFCIEKKVA